MLISIIIIPILFSSASAQQKQTESRDAEFYNNRGIAYMNKGQHDQAISDYTKALEINPSLAVAYINRGIAYYFKREYEKSWKDVEKAQSLGFQIHPKFLDDLRKASGRQK
jgi:tetratricopeptide (TPR) repeat protein